MAGEVVSEYALRLGSELGGDRLWVEGGYEAGASSMEFYLQPGPWKPSVEAIVIGKVHELVKRARE